MGMKGEPLPPAGQPLPAHLVPPSLRKPAVPAPSGTPVGGGVGPGSASGGTAPGTPSSVRNDLAAGGSTGDPGSPSTFEDKRRENFNKQQGQAELERRRQSLAEQQKKDEEERKREEKE